MPSGNVTTPFGRRPVTLAQIKGQLQAAEAPKQKSVDKWMVFRDACDARAILGLRDRALAVLNALLSFYPQPHLSGEENLIVFPSNAQLTARANGIAGTTLRENLALLVKAGLIHRKDSPNGKRYARKDDGGDIEEAYGFSLAPLLARSEELAMLAQHVASERRKVRILKEKITILRRDIRKCISAAMEEGADGDWSMIEAEYLGVLSGFSRAKAGEDLALLCDSLARLHQRVVKILEMQIFSKKHDANDDESRRHIQNSNTDSRHESEPLQKEEQGQAPHSDVQAEPVASVPARDSSARRGGGQGSRPEPERIRPYPLGMVLQACPEILMYGPGGTIANWRELMGAAVVVRSMLGVSPSAYQEACEVMGPENAATVMACILERAGHINSAGGYLRTLTDRARKGEFSLGPMLMALLRTGGGATSKAG